ncbi:glutamine-hydrolyzing GMP synthase [Spiroplasma endosymbiont of Labia minor]|uniref:glutamine-hydrolyzing GMP synthase n=1 Tax=Spiroplasma endosymbiont of Labia minor TaxID=3066305 RepID=UPI0030CC7A57
MKETQILILDFGSQYTQLLARRTREQEVFAEVVNLNITYDKIKKDYKNLKGIILSGGPSSAYDQNAYSVDPKIFELDIPILGVCYGMQLMTTIFGGEVELAANQEFGKSKIYFDVDNCPLFKNITNGTQVWMSHADHVTKLPADFVLTAHSDSSVAVIWNNKMNLYGIQFHAEVTHSVDGLQMIKNFLFDICKCDPNWKIANFVRDTMEQIKLTVGNKNVILGLSGGVDSSVVAALISKAIGQQLTCIFVDTGLLRKNEAKNVMDAYNDNFNINIKLIDAANIFFEKLKNVTDPEEKRKIIGAEFINIFNQEAKKIKNVTFLAQGTIYPDVIESSSINHSSKTIKSHHNVGGLPEEMELTLLEPIRLLFKDEVRKVGMELGLPERLVMRHPFPGPGLGIRVIGEVTEEKCNILKDADAIFIEEMYKNNLYDATSQAFVTLLPVKTVGVMGDNRTYEFVAALRCVETIDFMTATESHLPWDFLSDVANRIINEVDGINRVVYDITSKPPGTIEWE